MRLAPLALAILMIAPGAQALVLGVLGTPSESFGGSIPDGCRSENGTFACQWSFGTTDPARRAGRIGTTWSYPIPTFQRTLATITVALDGYDAGWQVILTRVSSQGATAISASDHAPMTGGAANARESTTHVIVDDPADPRAVTLLNVTDRASGTASLASVATSLTTSEGTFHVFYIAESIPPGTPPAHPAATRDYPQLVSPANDVQDAEIDLVAGWLNDRALDDGLLDAHLAVRGNLTHMNWNDTNLPADPGLPPFPPPLTNNNVSHRSGVNWILAFRVGSTQYFVNWFARATSTTSKAEIVCGLWRGPLEGTNYLIARPNCYPSDDATSNDTILNAEFPERSIGSPGPGAVFEGLAAQTNYFYGASIRADVDNATARFPFALGGPVVWDKFNNCHFCPAPVPWYQNPLAADNLPNAVQVGGAIIAASAFFFGLYLVRHRRAKVTKLLDEIERVPRDHEGDARGALLALEALDSRFAHLFRRGDLNESQFQVVSHRVAGVRLAIQHGLGAARSVPIEGPGEPRREVRH